MISPRVNIDSVRERIGAYAEQDYTQEERFAICKELIGLVPPHWPATEGSDDHEWNHRRDDRGCHVIDATIRSMTANARP